MMLVVFGLDSAASMWFWDKPERIDRSKTFSSWFGFNLVFAGFVSAALFAGSQFWSILAFQTNAYAPIWQLFAGVFFFSSFNKIANVWFRSMRKPVHAVAYSLGISLAAIALTLWLVVGRHWGLAGVYVAQLLSAIGGFVAFGCLLRDPILLRHFEWRRLKEMVRFGAPLVPAALSFWVMNSAATYVLNAYCPRSEVGLYQVGATIASGLGLFTTAFNQAWGPFALSIARRDAARTFYASIGEFFTIGGLVLAFFVSACAPLLLRIFATEKYESSRIVVGLLALNVVLLAVPQVITIPLAILKKNGPYARAVGCGAILTVPLLFILVPRFGKTGAALAVLVGNGFVPIYLFIVTQRLYPLPYAGRRLVITVAAALAALGLDMLLDLASIAYPWSRKIVIALILVVILIIAYRNAIVTVIASSPGEEDLTEGEGR
jgi:O-antigen/teichoic acid export membrane protein